ncbi:DHH family phosphoesterase [Paenibacillus mucilaginosus]|uniref:NrnB n=3 Tax=Paenibacillus mucilaginosus TaxID=61624 RepID=H6NHH7_9BACL|nr:oligoribonuclease [Paenibacillus mucilaginosus]AEI40996.1 NrnB [Paenibacillus mucilaginosus KNP414]AFC29574.1 NrnB [Paenibacillus mucilaginosus 3016]AFH61748.1 oligoribonuclease [Paenibacillus mucilaginosus K02]MCG7211559.1 oligoribonuclease [Paenibacillus mucilaginosus]WDM30071.1 oligoribonuclease [Paenibacillus mucilaginosus]
MYYLYTHNDLDGLGCGILAKCAFGDKVEIRYNSIAGLNTQVERFLERAKKKKHLFITDLAVNEANEQRIEDFVKSGGKVKLIDHHKSSLHLNRHPWALVEVAYDDGRLASATSLFYDYLLKGRLLKPSPAIEEFVELVRLYDTWEWDEAGNLEAKRLSDLFSMLSLEEFEERMLERLMTGEPFAFSPLELEMLGVEEERIGRYVRRKKREIVQTFVGGHCVGVVHAESYHSELGNELGKEYPHLDYIAIMNMGGKKASFRTIHDDVDVSAVAGQYGGGGHAKAAGCPMTEEVYRHFVAEPFTKEPLRMDAFRNEYNVKDSTYGTLYENGKEQQMFIFASGDDWIVDVEGDELNRTFPAFEEAERYVKRQYGAWLVRDEVYIAYLMEHMSHRKSQALVLM